MTRSAANADVAGERIDRVVVLDRGILIPRSRTAKSVSGGGKHMLREWCLHMSNFVVREAARRPDFDFERYGRRRKNPGWIRLPSA